MVNDLKLWQEVRELYLYMQHVLRDYPKSKRFTLVQKTDNKMLDMLEIILLANDARDKAAYIRKLDVMKNQLCMFIDIAFELQMISIKRYEYISKKTTSIGRLIGGWKKRFCK